MPRTARAGRSWLQVEIPKDTAERFRERARAEERTPTAQLRRLIGEYVSHNDESPVVTPGSRKESAGGDGRHDSSV